MVAEATRSLNISRSALVSKPSLVVFSFSRYSFFAQYDVDDHVDIGHVNLAVDIEVGCGNLIGLAQDHVDHLVDIDHVDLAIAIDVASSSGIARDGGELSPRQEHI